MSPAPADLPKYGGGKRRRRSAVVQAPPSRYQAFVDGELTAADLDDDEVMRLQLRDKNGNFTGRPPGSLPREFVQAMREEQFKRFDAEMRDMVKDARATLKRLMSPTHMGGPGDAAAFKAAQLVIERFAGKTPDNVNINASIKVNAWDAIADEVLVDVEEDEDDFDPASPDA